MPLVGRRRPLVGTDAAAGNEPRAPRLAPQGHRCRCRRVAPASRRLRGTRRIDDGRGKNAQSVISRLQSGCAFGRIMQTPQIALPCSAFPMICCLSKLTAGAAAVDCCPQPTGSSAVVECLGGNHETSQYCCDCFRDHRPVGHRRRCLSPPLLSSNLLPNGLLPSGLLLVRFVMLLQLESLR